ncbi:MAG TPA: DUF4185 domain-containing protein [Rhizomicrobium sp.]|nr:DUF4185 domain-containing protein [Rhizomicrobium sp.]
MKRILAIIAGVFGLIGSARAAERAPGDIERQGPPEKVCQLTGETDWQSGKPTQAKTLSRFGLEAADLGYPIEHNGKLILLFGDSWPTLQKPGTLVELPPNDAVGVVTAKTAPIKATCLGMQIQTVTGETMRVNGQGPAMKIYQPATIVGPQAIQQGFFDVPSGGVSAGDGLYGFFWTDHCSKGHAIPHSPAEPLARPKNADERCPETDALNSIGRGVMARSDDDGKTFHNPTAMPPGFVYSIAVNPAVEGAPGDRSILIFGVPRYRASVPYLAAAPVESFSNPAEWRFFVGRDGDGNPEWVTSKQWTAGYALKGPAAVNWHPPMGAPELFPDDGGNEACIGEFSVTWNAPLNKWLMLYNCHGIEARVADEPWGPWSKPTVILSGKDDLQCKILMSPRGCGDRHDFWPSRRTGKDIVSGGLYAPFVLNRYTEAGKEANSAVITWVLSTWNPYEVDVMRSTLQVR